MLHLKRDVYSLPVSLLGRLIYCFMPLKRSIAKKNIDAVFAASLSPKERAHLLKAYYSHIVLCFKEIILLSLCSQRYLEQRVSSKGIEYFLEAQKKGKGILILTGHFGCWEFAPLFFLRKINKGAFSFYCVRKSLRFKFLDNIFIRRFERAGFSIINKNNALKMSRSALKNNDVVFFPFDLKPKNESHLLTDFLGLQTATYPSAAYLADKLGCLVLSVTFYRVNKKEHVFEFYPEMNWIPCASRKEAYLENTKNYNQRLEEMLLPHPEQWLWSYKRW